MFALEIANSEKSAANDASGKSETGANEKPRTDVRAKASPPPSPHKLLKKRIIREREEVANLQQIMDQAKPWGENSDVEEQAKKIFELQVGHYVHSVV